FMVISSSTLCGPSEYNDRQAKRSPRRDDWGKKKSGGHSRPTLRNELPYYCGGGISFSTWIAPTSSEPSGSFGAPATNTFRPGLRSALVPGTVVAMMVFGVTRIFFTSVLSPILYSTVSIWPSTEATEVCNAPLVMKL